jgi:hypothetical protein
VVKAEQPNESTEGEKMASTFKQTLKENALPKAPAKKTSSVPIVGDAPAEVIAAATEFKKLAAKKREIEAEMLSNGNIVSDFCSAGQDALGFKGEYHKSFNVPAGEDSEKNPLYLMYSTMNKFKIDPPSEAMIKKLLGKAFGELIAEKFEVVLKPEVLEETAQGEALQKELMGLLGENFGKFFNTFNSFKVKDDYDAKVFGVAKTADKLAEIRSVIEPQKPSLK